MTTLSLSKSKKIQIAILIALTAGVILFSVLTDFPEGYGQGAVRNRRFGPAIQTPQPQAQSVQPQTLNNSNTPAQGYDMPDNGNLTPTTQITQPTTINSYDMPDNGN